MPDFAPNFTARYRLRYSVLGHEHSMLWRITRGTGSTGLALMVAKVRDFLNAIKAVRYTNWTELSAEYAPEDVDIFSPATLPGSDAGTAALPTNGVSEGTLHASWVGRSTAGQKAKFFTYGVAMSPEILGVTADDFRVFASENTTVQAGIIELLSGAPDIAASDNFPVIWYSYVNVKYNDHWIGEVRG